MSSSPACDTLICNARILDGTGRHAGDDASATASTGAQLLDLAVTGGRITAIGQALALSAMQIIDAGGLTLAPGFIDVHTHDDLAVIRHPQMLPKLSQGVTTVITGNCGISAAPFTVHGTPPDPMNLLGATEDLCYPTFAAWTAAVDAARPGVNVAALVGHTTLRSNHLSSLDRAATPAEIAGMQAQLAEALDHGAVGLSTGLAYLSAYHSSTEELLALASLLTATGAMYTTHLRSETAAIRDAIDEALLISRTSHSPLVISHLKCSGIDNWGRSPEILAALNTAGEAQPVAWDCYPYAASSSTLDLRQVDERVAITITWSDAHPELAGQPLASIAEAWNTTQLEAARRLQPAGAIYHGMAEEDVQRILQHPATMIGSDGLPHDPRPHPRLWGTFPRVLGRYSRDYKLFPLATAIHKMTGLAARRFGLHERGFIQTGFHADLVLFDPDTVRDTATYANPVQTSTGVHAVWVNGVLSYHAGQPTGDRAGCFLPRHAA